MGTIWVGQEACKAVKTALFYPFMHLKMIPNNTPLIPTTAHPLVGIITDMAWALCNPKNVYQVVTVHSKPDGASTMVTWTIRKKGARQIFVEQNSFDAILKRDRPYRYAPALMRIAYDQVLQISHSNKPVLEDGQLSPGAQLIYENESALHTKYR